MIAAHAATGLEARQQRENQQASSRVQVPGERQGRGRSLHIDAEEAATTESLPSGCPGSSGEVAGARLLRATQRMKRQCLNDGRGWHTARSSERKVGRGPARVAHRGSCPSNSPQRAHDRADGIKTQIASLS